MWRDLPKVLLLLIRGHDSFHPPRQIRETSWRSGLGEGIVGRQRK